jgi:hypothetical protein
VTEFATSIVASCAHVCVRVDSGSPRDIGELEKSR